MLSNRLQFAALSILCLAPTGCTVCHYARLVTVEEPRLYCEKTDTKVSLATYRAWADQAWSDLGYCCPDDCFEGDYAWGFREGFVQYVYGGGDGSPPVTPPRPYWQTDLRTPEGANAVRSWFQGYRHGAEVAREGGYRDRVTLTVSASLLDCDPCGCPDGAGACQAPTSMAPSVIEEPIGPELVPEPTEMLAPPEAQAAPPQAAPPETDNTPVTLLLTDPLGVEDPLAAPEPELESASSEPSLPPAVGERQAIFEQATRMSPRYAPTFPFVR